MHSTAAVADTIPLLGDSLAMQQVLRTVDKVAATDANVLLLGESGTGKALVAQAIHQASQRAAKPFVSVDMGSLSTSLLESELFGHKKGAFTDAKSDYAGRFVEASGGSLLLDELAKGIERAHQATTLSCTSCGSSLPSSRRCLLENSESTRCGVSVCAAGPSNSTWRLRPSSCSTVSPMKLKWPGPTGGWRHELEAPQYWEGRANLVRRLSTPLAELPEPTCDYLLQVTGLSEAQIRRLHVEHMGAPARLLDALELYQAHELHPDFSAPRLAQYVADRQVQPNGIERILRRTFPGLSARCTRELLQQCSGAQLDIAILDLGADLAERGGAVLLARLHRRDGGGLDIVTDHRCFLWIELMRGPLTQLEAQA